MRRLLVVLCVLVATLTFAPVASAVTQGTCGNPTNGYRATARVYENSVGDTSDGNDSWWSFCHQVDGFGYPDLRSISEPYGCHWAYPLPVQRTWNDCISSVVTYLPTSLWRVCFYRDLSYANLMYWVQGYTNGQRVDVALNDQTTSMRVVSGGQC